MANLKLSLEGELRSVVVHAFDQLGAALRETISSRDDVSDVEVRVNNEEATITMVISAPKWGEAAAIGSAVIKEAISRTGFTYIEDPDTATQTEKSVLNEGSRLTLL